jgi:ABC-type glycerol-3-phosphate transport system substrate-binding protein
MQATAFNVVNVNCGLADKFHEIIAHGITFYRRSFYMYKKLVLIAVLLITVLVFLPATGITEKETDDGISDVYIWPVLGGRMSSDGSDPAKYIEMQEYILEQTGVRPHGYATDTTSSDAATKVNLALASGEPRIDILQVDWTVHKNKSIIRLNDLLAEHGQNVWNAFPKQVWDAMTDENGDIWGISRTGIMGHTYFSWFQKELLEEAAVPLPTNFNDILPTLLAMREVNSNAVILTDKFSRMKNVWVGAFVEGGNGNWLDSDGNVQLIQTADGYRDFIATIQDWYVKGYIHPESFISHDNNEIIKTGNVAIWAGWYSRMTGHLANLRKAASFNKSYIFPERLMGDYGLVTTNLSDMKNAIAITKYCEDPVAAMKLLNWQYDTKNPENVLTAIYGIQGEDWDWSDPNDKYFMESYNEDYLGEFNVAAGGPIEILYAPYNELFIAHYTHIRDYSNDLSNGKLPMDYDVIYDTSIAKDNVMSWGDIEKMIEEEETKFIMGVRPMGEWDQFIDQLKAIGYDDVVAEYTRQYNFRKDL